MWNFLMRRCLEEVKVWTHDDKFFFLGSSLGEVLKDSTLVKCTYIFHVGINAEKFEKTRIRFNSDVPVVIFKAPYIHEHDTLILPETLMIEGGKVSWLYSLEELFILQNIADLKVIRYKVLTFDLGQKDDKEFFRILIYVISQLPRKGHLENCACPWKNPAPGPSCIPELKCPLK